MLAVTRWSVGVLPQGVLSGKVTQRTPTLNRGIICQMRSCCAEVSLLGVRSTGPFETLRVKCLVCDGHGFHVEVYASKRCSLLHFPDDVVEVPQKAQRGCALQCIGTRQAIEKHASRQGASFEQYLLLVEPFSAFLLKELRTS